MELTEEDVLEILRLFEQSKFDFLQLEQGERKITVAKGGYVPSSVASSVATGAASAAPRPAMAAPSPAAPPDAPKAGIAAIAEGLVAITAPMVGKFYASPSPSDPPYVQQGSHVAEGVAMGLIEVMKVFTSVKSEMAGTVERILVSNGQFVEYGQPLFLIRPDQKDAA